MNYSTVKVKKSKQKPLRKIDLHQMRKRRRHKPLHKRQQTTKMLLQKIRAPPKVPSPFRNWLYCAQKTKKELLSDAKFIDKTGQFLLTSTTSTRISPSIRGIQRHYIQARRKVKERIRFAKSTNEQIRIEDESSDNYNSKASETIDETNNDIRNIF